MTLPAGTRLGAYEISSPLGAGGMGEVYRARDTRLGREVAIKVLPEAVSADRERLSRFEQEARAASALNHPNIVTIHEIGRENDTAYIAMELVEGKTLREIQVAGPMPLRRILQIGAQVAEGLAKAHAAGIIHRDLKPENVMVSKDGFVKLLDFGLAKLAEPQSGEASAMPTLAHPETHPGTVLGTVAYMSPEQASGAPLDFRSDQFSLGSVLYEMATGQKAFARKTAAETMSAIIRDDPEPVSKHRPDLPLPVRWMLERCLAKEPEERYAATRDLARDLASVRDHISEVSSGGEGMLAATERPRRGRRGMLAAGAAAAAAGLAGFLLSRLLTQDAPTVPNFRRLTFRDGAVANARFAPDGRTVVYGARWATEVPVLELYRTQIGSPDSQRFEFSADILAIAPSGDLAVLLMTPPNSFGVLASVAMTGGTPRKVLEDVLYAGADYSPDGKEMAVAHVVDGRPRLEFPIGQVLYPGEVESPRISRDGRSVAAFVHSGETVDIVVIERAGGRKRVVASGLFHAFGAPCWSPDGQEIWYSSSDPATPLGPAALWAVDLSGKRRLLLRVPGSLELDDVSRDGRALLGHHTGVLSTRIATSERAGERDLSWLDESQPGDLSNDGRVILLNEVGEASGAEAVMYLRSTDGAPAARLGPGYGFAISPDGQWIFARSGRKQGKVRLMLVPTGAGQTRYLPGEGFESVEWGNFHPDGHRVVFGAPDSQGRSRLWVQSLSDGPAKPLGPERVRMPIRTSAVSPDGKYVAGLSRTGVIRVPFDGNAPAIPVPGIDASDERAIQWSADSTALYVVRRFERPQRVWLVDVESGQRRLWKEFPLDSSVGNFVVRPTPDGTSWATMSRRSLSELYAVEGLR